MPSLSISCTKRVAGNIQCLYCNHTAIRHGRTKQGEQRHRCKGRACRRTFLLHYINKACLPHTDRNITNLLREGCGIRSTGRLLGISNTTIIKRILAFARRITKPVVAFKKSYEVDEMCVYCRSKSKPLWLVYAMDKDSGRVADFAIGSRTKTTMNKVISTLLMSDANRICTDKLPLYTHLIPPSIYQTSRYGTNRIERMNLTLRTRLKRMHRRTICFSKRVAMLTACLTICFWS